METSPKSVEEIPNCHTKGHTLTVEEYSKHPTVKLIFKVISHFNKSIVIMIIIGRKSYYSSTYLRIK